MRDKRAVPLVARDTDTLTTLPWWWIFLAWGLMIAVSVATARGLTAQLVEGVVTFGAAAGVWGTDRRVPERWHVPGYLLATVGGIVAVLVNPNGLGYAAVIIGARNLPWPVKSRPGVAALSCATIGLGATSWFALHSPAAALIGLAVPVMAQRARERRELIEQRDRAQALLVEAQAARDAENRAAAMRERGRIAREMHDVLAHSLAGLSLQLQAARALAAKEGASERVLGPLGQAAELARSGLAEARQAVSTLRDPGGLGIAEIESLVQRHPGAATLSVTGEPLELPGSTGHTIYRAVQEALTNSARYAPGSPIAVTVGWAPHRVTVEITDDGPAAGHLPVTGQGSGLGMTGMQERLREIGGTVRAGPRPGGGWQVHLEVPIAGAAAPPPPARAGDAAARDPATVTPEARA